jgi:hypothetical protein
VATVAGTIAAAGPAPAHGPAGRSRWPHPAAGLVNAHDHLDLSTFRPWAPALRERPGLVGGHRGSARPAAVMAALSVSPPDRLFLGGLRNLLSGATAVAHHGPYHRALARPGLSRYDVLAKLPVRPRARAAAPLLRRGRTARRTAASRG